MRYTHPMIAIVAPSLAAAAVLLLGAAAPSPEQQWKSDIAGQNRAYADIPHAMLKIQDSAYLGEGQSATLVGEKGKPASWRWSNRPDARGLLKAGFHGGRLTMTREGKPVANDQVERTVAIDRDIDIVGHPTQVGAGVEGWRLFIYNQQSPAAKAFKGVAYYKYDPAFRVSAQFTPDPKRPARVFRTSRGTDKQFFHVGDARFTLKGKTVTLPFYGGSRDPGQIIDMSAFFTDKLTGKGAYGAGRYVDVAGFGKFPPRTITIDFNEAYNPNCARSPHFTCPVAVDNIDLAMLAGERDPHSLH
jgi:uncharacterized protein (DUF1684 family)